MKVILQKFSQSETALLLVGLVLIFAASAVVVMGSNGSEDDDGDGIVNSIDLCPATVVDRPIEDWGVNRYLWIGDAFFTVLEPDKGDKNKVFSEYSMLQTKGCSCIDIVMASSNKTTTDRDNNLKSGCTRGVISGWIRAVN